jgi:trans-aconitate methyltransferase
MDKATHWNTVYERKGDGEMSWFESLPAVSLALLESAGLRPDSCVLDVGGGDSRLVDALLARGLQCLAVLDISAAALDRARARLGTAAATPLWIQADVTGAWTVNPMDIWHDRAVFHFLTEPGDRLRYRRHLEATLHVGGHAIIATFAPEGPETCSGLKVARYSPETLAVELGDRFVLAESRRHSHSTPWGTAQAFQYSRFVLRH